MPETGINVVTAGQSRPVAAGTRIGHVHLKVADLERSLAFYVGVLGFELTQRAARRWLSSRPVATTTTLR